MHFFSDAVKIITTHENGFVRVSPKKRVRLNIFVTVLDMGRKQRSGLVRTQRMGLL